MLIIICINFKKNVSRKYLKNKNVIMEQKNYSLVKFIKLLIVYLVCSISNIFHFDNYIAKDSWNVYAALVSFEPTISG